MSRDAAIGQHLSALRELAQLKQNELAKKLEWSATVFSRVESGERPLTDDELDIILRRIGTPEAMRLKEVLTRRWQKLPEPPLGAKYVIDAVLSQRPYEEFAGRDSIPLYFHQDDFSVLRRRDRSLSSLRTKRRKGRWTLPTQIN